MVYKGAYSGGGHFLGTLYYGTYGISNLHAAALWTCTFYTMKASILVSKYVFGCKYS